MTPNTLLDDSRHNVASTACGNTGSGVFPAGSQGLNGRLSRSRLLFKNIQALRGNIACFYLVGAYTEVCFENDDDNQGGKVFINGVYRYACY